MNGLIEFQEPFLDYYSIGNSKTYYHLLLAVKFDIPVLVHSYDYRKQLICESKNRFKVDKAPIFCIKRYHDYYIQLKGTDYRKKKFIVDDLIVYRNCQLPNEIEVYSPEEVRDLVLTCLSEMQIRKELRM